MKKILGLIFGILFIASVLFFFVITGWYVAGAIFLGLSALVTVIQELKKRYETRCGKCKAKYDYDTDVSYRELRRWTKESTTSKGTSVQMFYQVEFDCECSACGAKKRYQKKIEGPKITENWDYIDADPEYAIMERFGKVGGEVTVGALFMLLVMSAAFIVGGLFFSGNLTLPVLSEISEQVNVEKGEDPADYYGKYYLADNYEVSTIELTATECTVTIDKGILREVETYTYEYLSAEYAAVRLQTGKPELSAYDVIFVHTSADKKQGWGLWVIRAEDGGYSFLTADGLPVTSQAITFSELIEDPKDYYGTYTLDHFFVTLNEDGTAVMDLGEGASTYLYMYADQGYLRTYFDKSYPSAILVYEAGATGAQIFNYKNGELILYDQYTFTK